MIEALQTTLAVTGWRDPQLAALVLLATRGAGLVAGATLLLVALGTRASAATRRHVWTAAALALIVLGAATLMALMSDSAPQRRWVEAAGTAAPGATFVHAPGSEPGPAGGGSVAIPWRFLWLTPTVLLLARLALAHGRVRRLVRRAEPLDSTRWSRSAQDVATTLRTGCPELLASATAESPLTVGIVRPRLLIPKSMRRATAERRRAVLLHELTHVRRRDVAARTVAAAACALHWFNPLAWLVARRLRIESERASDDAVLNDGVPAARYVRHLLSLAQAAVDPDWSQAAASSLGASELLQRVEAIGDARRRRRDPGRVLMLAVAAWVALLLAGSLQLSWPGASFRFVSADPEPGVELLVPAE